MQTALGGHQATWAVSSPIIDSYHPHPPFQFIIIAQPKDDTHFIIPWRVEAESS